MSEQRHEVRVFKVDYICDVCGNGCMRSTGNGFTTIDTIWDHECDACGHRCGFENVVYPRIVYEKLDEMNHETVYCHLCHVTFPAGAKSLHMTGWRDKELALGLTTTSNEDHERCTVSFDGRGDQVKFVDAVR